MMKKQIMWVYLVLTVIMLVLLGIFVPTTLLQEPNITPIAYLNEIPYWTLHIGQNSIIIIVPSSTIIVYLLGIEIIVLGVYFLKKRNHLPSFWWGISMVLWGIGTLLAGTSYQGLGYELKCDGQLFCLFTSWFELSYLYITALSISALAVAIAKSIIPIEKQKPILYYAFFSSITYSIVLLIGTIFKIRFLISYELFTIFFMPLFLVFFIYSIFYYRQRKDGLNKSLIIAWILFLIVNVAYYVYYFLGITESVYQSIGFWFSANDVLHVTLMIWMAYIWVRVKPNIHRIS